MTSRHRGAWLSLLFALATSPLFAQSVRVTAAGTIVAAHDGVIDLYTADAKRRIWRAAGVSYSNAIAVGEKDVAVLDPIENRAVIVDLETGTPRPLRTGETPIGAVFSGRDLYVLDRDARTVERIGPSDGARATVAVAADPAFLRTAGDKLYVYSRTEGALQEITLSPFALARTATVLPFASGLEVEKLYAYLVYPAADRGADLSALARGDSRVTFRRRGALLAVALSSMLPVSTKPVGIGAVPVGMDVFGGAANTSVMLAVADPSSKSVWIVEAQPSALQAMAREEFRGLVTLVVVQSVAFDSGVDRVSLNAGSRVAYDSSSGTLYRFSRRETSVLARGIGPNAFTAIPGGAAWWQNGTLVAQMEN